MHQPKTARKRARMHFKTNYRPGCRQHHDMRTVMDDLNVKVGSDNTDHDRAMGKEGCGSMNNTGERLLEFCTTYDLVIRGALITR